MAPSRGAGVEKGKPLPLCGSLFSLFLVQEAERMVYRSRGERWCVSLGAGALPVTPPGPASPSPCDPHPSPGPGPQDLTPALTDRALVVGPSGRRRPGCVQVTPAWLTWSGAEAALDGGSAVEKSGVHSAGGGTTERFHQGMVGWSGPEEESPRLWRRDSGGGEQEEEIT